MYRYEGNLHGVENSVVLISYPKEAFHDPKALRAFISTDVSLGTDEILNKYLERRPIKIFFRQSKDRLAFDRYQIRSSKGIQRLIRAFILKPHVKTAKMNLPLHEISFIKATTPFAGFLPLFSAFWYILQLRYPYRYIIIYSCFVADGLIGAA